MSRGKKRIKKNRFSVQMDKVCAGSYNTMIRAQAAPHFEATSKGKAIHAYVLARG